MQYTTRPSLRPRKGGAYSVTLHLYRRALAGAIARVVSPYMYTRDHDCILFEAREKRQLARVAEDQRLTLRLADDDSDGFSARHSSRDMVTTSNLEALGVDLNGATCMSTCNYLRAVFVCSAFFTSHRLIMSIL